MKVRREIPHMSASLHLVVNNELYEMDWVQRNPGNRLTGQISTLFNKSSIDKHYLKLL